MLINIQGGNFFAFVCQPAGCENLTAREFPFSSGKQLPVLPTLDATRFSTLTLYFFFSKRKSKTKRKIFGASLIKPLSFCPKTYFVMKIY